MTHYVIKFYYRLKGLFTNKSENINAGKRQRDILEDEDDENLETTFQPKRTKWSSDPISRAKMATEERNGPLSLPKRSVEKTQFLINKETKENVYDLTSDDDDIEDITPIRADSHPSLSPLPGCHRVHLAKSTLKDNHPSSTPLEQNGGTSSRYLNNGRISAHLRLSQKSGSSTSSMGTSRNHVRNSGLNESIRLEEKMRYSDLLNTFLHECNLPLTAIPSVELPKPISRETHTPPLIQKYRLKKSPSVHIIDLTKDVDAHIPVQKSNEPCQNRNDVHQRKNIVRVNSFEKKIKSYGFLGPQWITDMQSKYGAREREKRREMDEALLMKDLYEKRNKGFTEALSERIRKHLAITEIVLDETKEEIPTLPNLTPEMEKRIREAYIRTPPNEVVATGFGQRLTRKDICTLSNLNWLNDEVINFYMNLLIERGKNDNLPNVYAFNTFFYPKLISGGHSTLKRWTKKVDIFAQAMVIVPIHLGMHWCLSIIDFRDKTARYYDSMGSGNNQCLNALLKYLQDESLDKKKQPYDITDWKLENVRNIPQQMNGSDCGMFSCMFAEFISRNASITFTQDDMPYFRRKMTYEILTGKLLT